MKHRGVEIAIVCLCLLAAGVSSASAAAPTITNTAVSGVTTNSAILQAEVNPQGKKSFYHFEYGPQDCSTSTCTSVPIPDGKITANTSPVPVAVPVEGLTPGTAYHLRVVASNPDGETEGLDRSFATYVPPFVGLPDGRAYEQASPVKKNAADARGMVAWVKAADDGGAVSFLSTSGIAGAEGEQEVPAYLASRGVSNWSTQGLQPPATLGTEAFVRGWLPDFSEVFDYAGDFASGNDGTFVSRSSANGSLTQIVGHGEGLDRSLSYVGASVDGSEIFFEADVALACCDNAIVGKPNVYLWDRASGRIGLVSVLNDEKSPPTGASAGPYDWMLTPNLPLKADGGGSARGYYMQDLHVISDEGKTIYFTATGSGTLYARTNPSAEQSPLDGEGNCTKPVLACTYEISASHKTLPDPLGHRPAAFMAATRNGTSAFFTSPEELTNDANTGPVQPPPTIERAAVSGPPVETSFPISATGTAIDSEYLYWANPRENAIGRSKLNGEEANPIFISIPALKVENAEGEEDVPPKPQYVAIDGEHIYWTSEGDGENGEGMIGRADIKGTPASIEAEWIKGANRPKGIAVDDEYVYWANAGAGASDEGTIGRAKKSDGGGANQSFISAVGVRSPRGVAVDASHLYWSVFAASGSESDGYIYRSNLDGSNEILKFTGEGVQPRGVAVDGGHVYWASQGEEAIGRANLDLEEIQKKFIPTGGKPIGLSSNGVNLYWSVNGEVTPNPGNDLYLYRTDDESLVDLTADPTEANGAEVKGILGISEDGKRVYFAANGVLDDGAEAGDCSGKLSTIFVFGGHCSLYLAEEVTPGAWETSFITRLNASGGGELSDATNWLGRGGGASRSQRTARTSDDGQTLLFRSQEQLTSYDNEGHPELYRYEVGDDEPSCISCNPTGEAPSGTLSEFPIGASQLGSIGLSALEPQIDPAFVLSRNLSSNGARVFFESVEPLVVDDTNGKFGCDLEGAALFRFRSCQDVYEWEAQGTGSCDDDVQGGGCLYLLSTGTSPNASFFGDASQGGDDAFIATRSAGLVRQDQDQLQDVYDSRIGGGLASQNEIPSPVCESLDGCHSQPSPAPGFQSPASANLGGPGNKKHVRPHVKKRRQHKKHQHKRKRASHKAGGKSQ